MAVSAQPKVMTNWSRHDLVMQPKGNADHWAKMRYRASVSAGDLKPAPFPVTERRLSLSLSSAVKNGDGRFEPIANAVAQKVKVYDYHGNIPGNYASPDYAMYTTVPGDKKSVSACPRKTNQYHERAKQGYEFWYRERPKPTRFGRYGIGSYKTLLGLGNAPRT